METSCESHGGEGLSNAGRRELTQLFGGGERTTSVSRAAEVLGIDAASAAKRLAALAERGWLRRIRRGLYLAVPVDVPDPQRWTEDAWYLADLVWSPCYVTGFSAANHWSLTDQVFRSTVVATSHRVRRVEQDLASSPFLVHHVSPSRLEWGLRTEARHERMVRVASPSKTVAEVLDAPALGGGMRHVAEIVESFLESEGDPEAVRGELVDAMDRLGNRAAFKRLGHTIEQLGLSEPSLVAACETRVAAGVVALDPSGPEGGQHVGRWGLRANVSLDA